MNDQLSLELRIRRLERACKFGFLIICLAASYFSIRLAFSIGSCAGIYRDLLNGRELPHLTSFIIAAQGPIVLLCLALPAAALGLTLSGLRSDRSILGISCCTLLLLILTLLLWTGLSIPFFSIVHELTSNA